MKNPHAVILGRKGGKVSSPKKAKAARLNGMKPKKKITLTFTQGQYDLLTYAIFEYGDYCYSSADNMDGSRGKNLDGEAKGLMRLNDSIAKQYRKQKAGGL